jgi:SpoIIAA-like
MLELIEGYPESTVAVRGTGTVTADDYRDILIPAVDRATAGNGKARLLLELGEGFEGYDAGAVRADAGLGIGHLGSFDRIAVVTDHDGLRIAVNLFGIFIPGEVRLFHAAAADEARAWIAA